MAERQQAPLIVGPNALDGGLGGGSVVLLCFAGLGLGRPKRARPAHCGIQDAVQVRLNGDQAATVTPITSLTRRSIECSSVALSPVWRSPSAGRPTTPIHPRSAPVTFAVAGAGLQ